MKLMFAQCGKWLRRPGDDSGGITDQRSDGCIVRLAVFTAAGADLIEYDILYDHIYIYIYIYRGVCVYIYIYIYIYIYMYVYIYIYTHIYIYI